MSKWYINYKCRYDGTIETIEALDNKAQASELLREYSLVSAGYYLSKRATKDFYESLKV